MLTLEEVLVSPWFFIFHKITCNLTLIKKFIYLIFWYMYTCSFIGVEKYIFVGKIISKVIQFFFKDVIIDIEFHFKLVNNYFELYEKSNKNYI